jgi:hypothetical protein
VARQQVLQLCGALDLQASTGAAWMDHSEVHRCSMAWGGARLGQ